MMINRKIVLSLVRYFVANLSRTNGFIISQIVITCFVERRGIEVFCALKCMK